MLQVGAPTDLPPEVLEQREGGRTMQLPAAIDIVRPSIVQISVRTEGRRGPVLGTGFIAHEDGLVLTAAHVSQAARSIAEQAGGRVVIGLPMPAITSPMLTIRGSFEVTDADVVEEDPRHDLALLRMGNNPFASGRRSGVFATAEGGTGINALFGVANLHHRPVRDGEPIAVSGYPMDAPALITTSGAVASAFGVDIVEMQLPGAPEGFRVPDVADSYLADVAVNPGNSGGPVYRLDDGKAFGVCVAFRIANAVPEEGTEFSYNSGLTVVVPIQYGLALLERHIGRAVAS